MIVSHNFEFQISKNRRIPPETDRLPPDRRKGARQVPRPHLRDRAHRLSVNNLHFSLSEFKQQQEQICSEALEKLNELKTLKPIVKDGCRYKAGQSFISASHLSNHHLSF